MAEEVKLKVIIDGIPVEVTPGTTILNAARQIGGDIVPPAMCYYSKLEGTGGKCRTCLVKVSKGSEKDPRPMPKLVASCRTTVMDGMEVENITKILIQVPIGIIVYVTLSALFKIESFKYLIQTIKEYKRN